MQPINRKVTIYDIAQLSGASPSTVSAVLNGTWARRRIGEQTVELIQKIAAEAGYSANLQARGLRRARSGLVGMIIPLHDNRFFSSLSQSFDLLARERGLCPVIASTLRKPEEERRIVETLIAYAVDALFIAGATDAESLGAMCAAANMRHIFVDLPGKNAPSVVTDNYRGAELLTGKISAGLAREPTSNRDKAYFLGGSSSDHATARRIAAFRDVLSRENIPLADDQIIECGYAPRSATAAIAQLCARLGGLPKVLFVNSFTAFEGVMSHFVTLPVEAFNDTTIGCYDYDPFAAYLQFPVYMVRQNSNQLIAKAYELLEAGTREPVMIEIEPDLVAPRTIHSGSMGDLG